MIALPLRDARENFEREYLKAQINRFGGNISRTATFHRHGALRAASQTENPGCRRISLNRKPAMTSIQRTPASSRLNHPMKAVVCGAGRVGYGIARELASEGNAVTVVDWSRELIDKVTTDLDVRGVVGHGSHPDVLDRRPVSGRRTLLVAVTYSDETNMVACQVAHSSVRIPRRASRG
jgi:hypothetical protein